MTIEPWFLPSIIALVLWGVTMFLPKITLRTLPALHLVVYGSCLSFVMAAVMMAFYGFRLDFDSRSVVFAVMTGVLGQAGTLMYIFAIRNAPMTYGVVMTSLYPVVAAALSFLILHETLTLRQTAGIVLGLCSLILMVVASDDKAEQ